MLAQPDFFYISPDDYLAGERGSPIKHEYRQGRVYAMVGAKKPHVILAANLTKLLGIHLEGSPCVVMASDMKVRLSAADCYYYPDVVVTCDPRDIQGTEDFIEFPKLVIEILSQSTQDFDRGQKFADYQTCPTLEEYVLVSQTQQSVEVRSRLDDAWQVAVYQMDEPIRLQSIDCCLNPIQLYDRVTLVEPGY
jgi:Uma2 family endonuclease